MFVELPTSDGPLWVNPQQVVGLRHAEEGRTHMYAVTTAIYTVLLPVAEVAALLGGQQPVRVATVNQ